MARPWYVLHFYSSKCFTDLLAQIQPGDIEVSSIGKTVGNGEIWILKGVLNYAQDSN